MAEKGGSVSKRRVSGKFCVAGGPGNVSCTNKSLTPGISMHTFPSNAITRRKWTQFVQKHRKGWEPSSTSVLCSVHFTPECFERRIDLLGPNAQDKKSVSSSKRLIKGAVPTIDAANVKTTNTLSRRDKKQIIKNVLQGSGASVGAASVADIGPNEEPSTSYDSHVPVDDGRVRQIPTEKTCCSDCKNKSKSLRKIQKENSYLRRRVRQLKETQLDEYSENTESSDDEIFNDDLVCGKLQAQTTTETETETEKEHDSDPDWTQVQEEKGDNASDDEETAQESNISVEPGTPYQDEPKFIVFYSMLLSLFSMFCFNCKADSPSVSMKKNGTMVSVTQTCASCAGKSFTWHSQPFILGRHPAGNLMLSFGILMAGAYASKVLLCLKHMGLSVISLRTFFQHQNKFLFPAILRYWEIYKSKMVNQLKKINNSIWCGDGRFDSMGHSAKYGVYSMFSSSIMKIVHFELLQANQVGSSQAMELAGAKKSFQHLTSLGLQIKVFISDRHRGISKWIREKQPNTKHYFDIWHVARSITKKMQKASKEKGLEIIKEWIKSVRNHVYWVATSTREGFHSLIIAKWKSFMRHIANRHDDHPDPLFKKCAHEADVGRKKWVKIGTKAYDKLNSILMNTRIIGDIKQLSADAQTSCLEGFHATLNFFHPKMLCFSWLGTYCRHILASLHFNENLNREPKISKKGTTYYKVTWPKFKEGEELVREVAVPHTYEYVAAIKNTMFSESKEFHAKQLKKYSALVPEPLNRKFEGRVSKEEAVTRKEARAKLRTKLFPEAKKQDELESNLAAQAHPSESKKKRRQPCCSTCGKPMKGHNKDECKQAESKLPEK